MGGGRPRRGRRHRRRAVRDPIFINSDNGATGAVIDLVGPDAVNLYIWDVVGMGRDTTALTQWNYNATREAANSPRQGPMGSDKYTTADDAVVFLAGLQAGALLDAEATAALLDWMTRAPRSGTGGWLSARLPGEPQAGARHKGGWLPPGCCSSEERYNTLNEVGLVNTPRGTYAVAILTHAGDDWYGRQAALYRPSPPARSGRPSRRPPTSIARAKATQHRPNSTIARSGPACATASRPRRRGGTSCRSPLPARRTRPRRSGGRGAGAGRSL